MPLCTFRLWTQKVGPYCFVFASRGPNIIYINLNKLSFLKEGPRISEQETETIIFFVYYELWHVLFVICNILHTAPVVFVVFRRRLWFDIAVTVFATTVLNSNVRLLSVMFTYLGCGRAVSYNAFIYCKQHADKTLKRSQFKNAKLADRVGGKSSLSAAYPAAWFGTCRLSPF